MNNCFFIIFVAFIIFSACNKSGTDIPVIEQPPVTADTIYYNENPIMYCGMAVGQKSVYVLLEGRHYYDTSVVDDFDYLPDTLVVEIIGEDEHGFLVKEYLTEGSDISLFQSYFVPDSSYQYYLKIEDGFLHFFDFEDEFYIKSSLFWGWEDSLDLNLFAQEVDIVGWKTTFPYCECEQMGYDPSFDLLGITYDDLNISIRNTDMQMDLPGTTFMYSNNYGMIRSSHYSWWTQSGYGWDLLGVQ
ncbi:MAG TPA: hypothetical protein ENJ95_06720 [Bacteroidetes bacterium]|nr:hypothetical protein [Bacteroidota bacterium]